MKYHGSSRRRIRPPRMSERYPRHFKKRFGSGRRFEDRPRFRRSNRDRRPLSKEKLDDEIDNYFKQHNVIINLYFMKFLANVKEF